MPTHQVRHNPERLDQPEQRHLDREQTSLGEHRLIQQLRLRRARIGEQHRRQRLRQQRIQLPAHLVQRGGENGESVIQLPTHARALRALTGEEDRELAAFGGGTGDDRAGRVPTGQGGQRPEQAIPVRRSHHGPLLQSRPGGHRRPRHIDRAQRHAGCQPARPAARLRRQRGTGPRRQQHRHRTWHPRHQLTLDHGQRRTSRHLALDGVRRRLFEDHVRVGAGDAERGNGGPARPVHGRPRGRLGRQGDGPGGPVDVRRRLVHVQARWHHTVPHGQDHLDHAGHTGRSLRVADVRLDRPQPQRPVGGPVLPVRRQQRLRLDRVTQRRARAVCLDGVHVRHGQARVRQGLPDHPLLRRPVRRGQPVRRAVLVDGGAPHHGEDPVTVPSGVGQPLHQQHAHPLRPAGAVRRRGERLAPTVLGQAALPGELDERARRGHHRHATGESQVALPRPQRLRGQVQRDQRRRTRRVHRDRRTFQPERVRHPPRQHTARGARADVALGARGKVGQLRGVVVVHHAGEHARTGAAQPRRIEAGGLERLPRRLQQQPLLRVHGDRLPGRDPEEGGVEVGRPGQESAVPGVRGAAAVRVGVEEAVEVPAPIGGELRDPVPTGGQQLPELVRAVDAARIPAGHADDRDRLVGVDGPHRRPPGGELAGDLLVQVPGEHGRGGVVEDQRRGQPQPGGRVDPVAQVHGGQRVETQLPESPVHRHRLRAAVPQHLGDQAPDQQVDPRAGLVRGQAGQLAGPVAALPGLPAADRRADQGAQHRRHPAAGAEGGPHRGYVDDGRHQHRPARAQGRVEQLQPDLDAHRRQAGPSRPRPVRLRQRRRHAGGVPHSPRQADRRQTRLPPVRRQRVQVGVRRGVRRLTRRPDQAGHRREHHEQVEVTVDRRLVQPPRGGRLRRQHTRQPLGAERRHHAVVQHARGVHHPRQPAGHTGHQLVHLIPVGDVGRDHGHPGTQARQPLHQRVRTRRGRTPP
ncbi:hypothetical protein B0E53_06669 [Micromonospora sp. MH33]|nr:hypothetical protein B0E53_06669 [Micromonospora sp. MH33]